MTQIISTPKVFEGTWDEVLAQGENWIGRRVRIAVLEDEKPLGDKARVIPAIGSGTFEEVMALVQSFSPPAYEESLLDAIMESRTLRRQIAEEQNR